MTGVTLVELHWIVVAMTANCNLAAEIVKQRPRGGGIPGMPGPERSRFFPCPVMPAACPVHSCPARPGLELMAELGSTL